jgi:hypothetical protein
MTAAAWYTYWDQFAWDQPTVGDLHAILRDLEACEAEVARLRALLTQPISQEAPPHAPREPHVPD